jgi:hypothetical protein
MSNKPALIITIIVALLAAASVIYAVMVLSEKDSSDNPGTPVQTPAEVPQEMYNIAEGLIHNNFEVFRLFYRLDFFSDTFAHFEQVYDKPEKEDGYYILRAGILTGYSTIDDIFRLVDETFIEEIADSIKGFSPRTTDGGALYRDFNGRIGVNETFSPMGYDYTSGMVELTFISEEEYLVNVILINELTGQEIPPISTAMRKYGDTWRLTSLVYRAAENG